MASHGLSSALTLYDARTLTLSQAATRAGVSEEEFVRQLNRHGIQVTVADRMAAAGDDRTAHAD